MMPDCVHVVADLGLTNNWRRPLVLPDRQHYSHAPGASPRSGAIPAHTHKRRSNVCSCNNRGSATYRCTTLCCLQTAFVTSSEEFDKHGRVQSVVERTLVTGDGDGIDAPRRFRADVVVPHFHLQNLTNIRNSNPENVARPPLKKCGPDSFCCP